MNSFFWILQVLLALHTATGAIWKFFNSEQATSLGALPHGVWLGMSVLELLCVVALLLPAVSKKFGALAPAAAVVIAVEMLAMVGAHLASGQGANGQVIYWMVVAAFCAFVAYGRFAMEPIKP
jgi:hypothetical protein